LYRIETIAMASVITTRNTPAKYTHKYIYSNWKRKRTKKNIKITSNIDQCWSHSIATQQTYTYLLLMFWAAELDWRVENVRIDCLVCLVPSPHQ
jgi:hypothetical protein